MFDKLKECAECRAAKTPRCFYKNRTRPDKLDSICKMCRRTHSNKSNPKNNPINNWRKNGIHPDDCTQERFEWFFKKAGGRCEVCRILLSNPFARDPGLQTAHYDHCHISGRARGILCGTCNGRFVGALDRIAWKRYWGGTREKAIATAGYFLRTMKEADDA